MSVPKLDEITIGEINEKLINLNEENSLDVKAQILIAGKYYPPISIFDLPAIGRLNDTKVKEDILLSPEMETNKEMDQTIKDALEMLHTLFILNAKDAMVKLRQAVYMPKKSSAIVSKRWWLSWHPYVQTLAVSTSDTNIALYHVQSMKWDARMLQHHRQYEISCMAFDPSISGNLAVGCASGDVLIWKLVNDTYRLPVVDTILRNESPVACLSWSPDGRTIAIGSLLDSRIMLWDVATTTCRPVGMLGGEPLAILKWAPKGKFLFAATLRSSKIYIFETQHWTYKVLDSKLGGPCMDACWNPNGNTILVAYKKQLGLFPIHVELKNAKLDLAQETALRINKKKLFSQDGSYFEYIDGAVQHIAWDPHGKRVVVSFVSENISAAKTPLIAIYSISNSQTFSLRGYARGPPHGKQVVHIEFCKQFTTGSLLAIRWESGVISFIPFYYST